MTDTIESLKAERDAAIAERDDARILASKWLNGSADFAIERDAAIAERDAARKDCEDYAKTMDRIAAGEASGRRLIAERDAAIAERDALREIQNLTSGLKPATAQALIESIQAESAQLQAQAVPEGEWREMDAAPKTDKRDLIVFEAWCPDDTAPGGGDIKIVWWEPLMNKGKGCWYSDGELAVSPTLWRALRPAPLAAAPLPPGEKP